MVGTTVPTAPSSARASAVEVPCSFVRGMSTCQPKSGLDSNQLSSPLDSTPCPMITTIRSVPDCAMDSACFKVVSTLVCSMVEIPHPRRTFVSSSQPSASRASIACSWAEALPVSTWVVLRWRETSTWVCGPASMKRTERTRLVVSAVPVKAAVEAESPTPGTISTSTCSLRQTAASAVVVVKMIPSSELSRTTVLSGRASSAMRRPRVEAATPRSAASMSVAACGT